MSDRTIATYFNFYVPHDSTAMLYGGAENARLENAGLKKGDRIAGLKTRRVATCQYRLSTLSHEHLRVNWPARHPAR